MTTVETTVALSISPKGHTLEELETQIGEALQQAGKDLLVQACRVMGSPGAGRTHGAAPEQAAGPASTHPLRLDAVITLADVRSAGTLLLSP